jgi:hypothetical protein
VIEESDVHGDKSRVLIQMRSMQAISMMSNMSIQNGFGSLSDPEGQARKTAQKPMNDFII